MCGCDTNLSNLVAGSVAHEMGGSWFGSFVSERVVLVREGAEKSGHGAAGEERAAAGWNAGACLPVCLREI